jgi:hypothetical protein
VRKVIGMALLVVALAAMVGTVSAQGNGVIEPWKVRTHSQGAIRQP